MTPPEGFLCKQCGRCCLDLDGFSTSAYPEDVARWRAEGREDILEWVDIFYYCGQEGGYDIWISPVTGEGVPRCPWLRKYPKTEKYYCRIHDTKPKHCRDYPLDKKQALEHGCKGFES